MLHTIAMIIIPLGAALVVASILIFLITDCKDAFNDLRTTNTIMPEEIGVLPAINDIYYDSYSQKPKKEKEKPKFVMEEKSEILEKPKEKEARNEPVSLTSPLVGENNNPSDKMQARDTSPLENELKEPVIEAQTGKEDRYTAPLIQETPKETAPLTASVPRETSALVEEEKGLDDFLVNKDTAPLIVEEDTVTVEDLLMDLENKTQETGRLNPTTNDSNKTAPLIQRPPADTEPLFNGQKETAPLSEPFDLSELG